MKLYLFGDSDGRYMIISSTRENARIRILDSIYGVGEWLPDIEAPTLEYTTEYPLDYPDVIDPDAPAKVKN